MVNDKKDVVVVGGGFGGVKTALELSKSNLVNVTLISDKSAFWFYPSFYRTATGAPSKLSVIPLINIFENKNIKIVISPLEKIKPKTKYLILKNGKQIKYDYCVLALGVVTNYFGIKGLEQHSYGVKTITDVNRLKKHLHQELVIDKVPDLNYVIVGGGPTGVELSGELSGYLKHIAKKHNFTIPNIKISIIEATNRLLPKMNKLASKTIKSHLEKNGINIILNTPVMGETANNLLLKNKSLLSHTVIWTAGQANNNFYKANNFILSNNTKVKVDDYLEAMPDVYVIGDNADTKFSGQAQTGIYDALFVSKNIINKITGKIQIKYAPKKPIYVIPAGKKWALVEIGKYQFHGFFGWLLRHAGNIKGFLEIEDPIDAGEQWLHEFETEYYCKICDS